MLPGLSTRPQEPRRPRFPFFQSSQCQRADPGGDFRRRRRWRLSLRISRTMSSVRLPGSRPALAVNRQTVGATGARRRSARRVVVQAKQPVNTPISHSPDRNSKFLSFFSGLLQSLAPRGAAVLSDGRVIGATLLTVNSPCVRKMTFLSEEGGPPPKRSR